MIISFVYRIICWMEMIYQQWLVVIEPLVLLQIITVSPSIKTQEVG